MDFLKKHYEKLLLGVMLVGLIGVLVFMLFYIAADKTEMAQKGNNYTAPRARGLTNLDMTLLEGTSARVQSLYNLDLESSNKLLNPMEWQREPDGTVIEANRTGLGMVDVTNITPLYTIVSLDSVITNELGVRYLIKVERQAASQPAKRRLVPHYVSKGEKANADFALVAVKGPEDNPDSLSVRMVDSGEEVTIAPNKPFRRVDGYMADFNYDPERRVFHGRRTGDHVAFGGQDYAVVDITKDEVVLQDQSNQKKNSLPLKSSLPIVR